ncbi:MAG: cation transporter, partial [Leptolyngbyaceae cyanobacterium]
MTLERPLPAHSAQANRPSDHRAAVRRVLVITLLLNLIVVGLKSVVGVWTGSLSLLADALHSV